MKILYLFVLLSIPFIAHSQITVSKLYDLIFEKDSLFWSGYNSCNYDLMEKYLAKNTEFYHDKGGILYGADQVMEATRKNICGNQNTKIKRLGIAESMKIYPMINNAIIYGAILSGEHYFYQNDVKTGVAKFFHLWLLIEGEWRMHKIMSFDHQPAQDNTKEFEVPPGMLEQYIGTYTSLQFGEVIIKNGGTKLLLLNEGNITELLPKNKNNFYIPGRNIEFKFEVGVKFDVLENGQKVDEVKLKTAETDTKNVFESRSSIDSFLKKNKIPALGLVVIKNSKLKISDVYGNLKDGAPATRNAIFNVASLTKPVVAYLTLKLVSQGKWNLDEPLYKYWIDPDLKGDERHKKLTTRMVLTHQTGFPNWRYLNKDQKLAFQNDPGTQYGYSGEGLEYLRKALEMKFKKPLEKLIQENVFTPLKMNSSYMKWSDTVNENIFAVGHSAEGTPYTIHKERAVSGADDLLTSISDYTKFLSALNTGTGLSKKIFTEMQSNQLKTKENKYFGLGLEKYDLGNGTYALSHGGSDEGCRTIFFIFPKSKDVLLIFTNSDTGMAVYLPAIEYFLGNNGQKIVAIEMKK